MKVLIVEDDERIADPLKEELEHQQYVVLVALDGECGLSIALEEFFDVILLDVMLPKLDGISLCRKLRQSGCNSAILMLTAKDKKSDKIQGLDAGADDYLIKPFDLDELLARIRAVIRRQGPSREPMWKWLDLELDPAVKEVRYAGRPIELTPTEFRLLLNFMRNPNQTFSKDQLLGRLWLSGQSPTEDVIKAHMKGLRHKLNQAGAPKNMIETVYGFGYRLKSDVS
jgi:DNA-binding response OmpR family regulator